MSPVETAVTGTTAATSQDMRTTNTAAPFRQPKNIPGSLSATR